MHTKVWQRSDGEAERTEEEQGRLEQVASREGDEDLKRERGRIKQQLSRQQNLISVLQDFICVRDKRYHVFNSVGVS